jgi:circadian clock protein KaiC
MVGALTGSGVTICMTIEVPQSFTDLLFTPNLVSFLADDVIIQRYVEVEGRLRKALTVVKMRGSQHSADIRFYDVTAQGLVIGDRAVGYSGVLTGAPVPLDSAKGQ